MITKNFVGTVVEIPPLAWLLIIVGICALVTTAVTRVGDPEFIERDRNLPTPQDTQIERPRSVNQTNVKVE